MPPRADRALLLRRFPYGESSLVLHALTPDHGRVHLIAKGVYRPTSRYFAALDLFDTLAIEWSHVPNRELQTLRAASILQRRAGIPHDLDRYRAALVTLELASAAAHEARPERELFDALARALDRLVDGPVPATLALVEFELAFLHNLGLAPALGHCAACGRVAPRARAAAGVTGRRASGARVAFSAGAGGRLCRVCAEEARGAGRRVGTLPLNVLECAQSVLETIGIRRDDGEDGDVLEAMAERCDAAGLERVRDFVARFLEYHLEARPKSYRAFLAGGNRNAAGAPGAAG